MDTTDILFILSGAFVGLDKVVGQRIAKGVGVFLFPVVSVLTSSGGQQSIGFGAPLASDAFVVGSSPMGASSVPFFTKNSESGETNPYDLVEPNGMFPVSHRAHVRLSFVG